MKKVVFVAIIIAMVSIPASAATFADMMNSIGESVNALGSFARLAFAVLGFACIGIGIVNMTGVTTNAIANSGDSKYTIWGKLYWILAGAGLLCLSYFGMMASESLGLSGTIDF